MSALRTIGAGNDGGATAGSTAPATSWVVADGGGRSRPPRVTRAEPGQSQASVSITGLPDEEGGVGRVHHDPSPWGRSRGCPREFLDRVGGASLLVISDGVPVVALGASTSLGNEGLSVYGLAAGCRVEPGTA